jgi:hypothetical protein
MSNLLNDLPPVERALMEAQQKRSWVIGETGRDPGLEPLALEVLRLRRELQRHRGDPLDAKEAERLERLKSRAYYLQNQIDARPRYNMDRSRAELSALCWAVEKITGEHFDTGAYGDHGG